ncbi:MAG: hypothetical protein ABII75_09850 [Candidatus Omnitrophota bacterium]
MNKKREIMQFLSDNIFDPILNNPAASETLKKGVRYTIMRLNNLDAFGMVSYYWSAIVGTEKSTEFARQMRAEGFTRFEEVIDEFRDRFDDDWLRSPEREV